MTTIDFWFDSLSPYAWLAFERLPQALAGHSVVVRYQPLLLAGLLAHWGSKGPAELAPKRDWTYRQVAWRAHELGLPLQLPAQHPFNPLALLRLLVACAPAGGTPNRRVVEAVLRHVWRGEGADANAPSRLERLSADLTPLRDPASDEVKAELRAATEAAVAAGLFGVPTIELAGRHFWGLDALPMVAACLRGDPWFDGPAWDAAAAERPGLRRG
jgi:2-hydroxychromene-2-carboxylate isomerase